VFHGTVKRNGVEIFTPRNKVTKSVIVDCEAVRVLPPHFISIVIAKSDTVVLVNVSYASKKILSTIGVADDVVCMRDDILSAMKHIEGKV
jgi:hypothetical protein